MACNAAHIQTNNSTKHSKKICAKRHEVNVQCQIEFRLLTSAAWLFLLFFLLFRVKYNSDIRLRL